MATSMQSSQLTSLARHLDAQRTCAMQLIETHNRLLASILVPGAKFPDNSEYSLPTFPPETARPSATEDSDSNVVSLFDYSATCAEEAPAKDTPERIFEEFDPDARAAHGSDIDRLLDQYGADDALAINRKQMTGSIFLTRDSEALFFLKRQSDLLFVACYVGPDSGFVPAMEDLNTYAEERGLLINFMAHEGRIEDLKSLGFSTTPIGIWQRVEPLSGFTLQGSAMRRLRYLVSKYAKSGDCRTIEYEPGTDSAVDREICAVIDQWVALKEQNPAFIDDVKKQINAGSIGSDHRFFLTWRDQTLDNVVVFSRDNRNNGYLMDLEFYGADMPLGSTEFALSEIIARFRDEEREVVSLGLTMGTGLFEHENGCPEVHKLFESLRKADYLNGDANAQYKNKYRPVTTPMFLARPAGSGSRKLNDLMMLLGNG